MKDSYHEVIKAQWLFFNCIKEINDKWLSFNYLKKINEIIKDRCLQNYNNLILFQQVTSTIFVISLIYNHICTQLL